MKTRDIFEEIKSIDRAIENWHNSDEAETEYEYLNVRAYMVSDYNTYYVELFRRLNKRSKIFKFTIS